MTPIGVLRQYTDKTSQIMSMHDTEPKHVIPPGLLKERAEKGAGLKRNRQNRPSTERFDFANHIDQGTLHGRGAGGARRFHAVRVSGG